MGGTLTGSRLLVIPATAREIAEQIPDIRAENSVFTKRRFAFVVDVAAYIG
jgi:hypothetical protein